MADPGIAVRFLPGIGPARAELLAAVGLKTAWDILHAVPRCLGPPPPLCESGPPPRGATVRLRARLISARPVFGRRGRGLSIEASLERADGYALSARFFNAGYLRRHLLPNEWYLWEGKTDAERAGALLHPSFTHLPQGPETPLPEEPGCRVAYRLPEGFSERTFLALVRTCLDEHLSGVTDPASTLAAADYQARLRDLHQPATPTDHERARRALAARELLALAWRMQVRRAEHVGVPGRAWSWTDLVHQRALARLPFELTPGQEAALAAIRADARAPRPMYRLLHGDVGSGKTALAFVAALAVIADGAQVVLFAPTAVLASQHFAFCRRCLDQPPSRVRLALLTGGTPADERARILADLAGAPRSRIDLLIGTHALLEEDVRFADLGLVVIDEQHKFGVEQRATLVGKSGAPATDAATSTAASTVNTVDSATKSYHPDLLLMTATPIPRTLALTVFGDLDVSRIDGKPPGRAAVTTGLAVLDRAGAAVEGEVAECLDAGGRAFVICPLKEESEKLTAADAQSIHRRLAARFGEATVGLMHGSLPEARKLALMAEFATGPVRVLVSTTVVEVGIDVAEATLLCVLDAERFGLSQLHQLRGRIGRGDRPGRCLLYYRGAESPDRLQALVAHDDGLAIAEADLATRGPGQLLGTAQHGMLDLGIADLTKDLDLLPDAHDQARARIAKGERMPEALARLIGGMDRAQLLAGG